MPQVPYQPVPNVAEEGAPAPGPRVDTPGAAFGTNIAEQIQRGGQTLGGVGNELFARAMAIQELRNDSEAREGIAKYMGQQGEMHAQYGATQQNDAVKGLQPYIQKSQELLNQTASTMSNAMSRKAFLDASTFYLGRNINAAASHAAQENKKYTDTTINSAIQSTYDAANLHPTDESIYRAAWNNYENEFHTKQGIYGWSDETRNEELAKARSGLTAARIDGLRKVDPPGARTMMNDAIKEGRLRSDDINKTYDQVKQSVYSTGVRHEVNKAMNVNGQDISYGSKVVPIGTAAKAIGAGEGNYDSVVNTGTKQGNALGRYQVTEANLPGFLRLAGLSPMTPQEFIANHDAQDKVFAVNFGLLQTKYGNFNDAASEWLTGKSMAEAGDRADKFGTTAQVYVQRANARLAASAPNAAIIDKARANAETTAGNDPFMADFPQAVVDGTAHELGRRQYQERLDNWDRADKVNNFMMGMLTPGAPVPSLTDLEAKPEWADLTRDMNATEKIAMEKRVDSLLKERFRDTEDVEKGRLIDLAQRDPEAFMDEDITGNRKLSPNDMKSFIAMRRSVRNNEEADPQVGRAMKIFADNGQLDDLGLDKTEDPIRFHQFTALLFDALSDQRQENKGLPPTADQILAIGKRLGAGYVTGFWGKPAFFEKHMTLSAQEIEKRRDDYGAQHPDEPMQTDAEIARDWIRGEYEKAYVKGKKAKTETAGAPEIRS